MTQVDDDGGARARLLAATHAELADHGRAAVSLRAVARRAGVSHAAPQYHFGDRSGLLTAAAADGFRALGDALEQASDGSRPVSVDRLGQAYVAFGCAHPALFDLMFRPGELRGDDPELRTAKRRALEALRRAIQAQDPTAPAEVVADRTLASWGFVHGLVVLALAGALTDAAGALGPNADAADAAALAGRLVVAYPAPVTEPG